MRIERCVALLRRRDKSQIRTLCSQIIAGLYSTIRKYKFHSCIRWFPFFCINDELYILFQFVMNISRKLNALKTNFQTLQKT